jgi:hypothetical protein
VAYDYDKCVFINCPFDKQYKSLFNAIVFSVFDCGFLPRCARELDDGSDVRINKLYKLISACKYGIRDISRTDLDKGTKLPRFNMPFDLGLFMGIKSAGGTLQKRKVCLILDVEKLRIFSLSANDMTYTDYARCIAAWLTTN